MKVITKRYSKTLFAIALSASFTSMVYAKDGSDMQIKTRVMLDHNTYDQTFLEHETDSVSKFELRRARLTFKAKVLDDWKAKLQLSFEDEEIDVKDAKLTYKGWNIADLTLGYQKEPFGLERLTSSSNLLMAERSMVTQANSPGRSLGAGASGKLELTDWPLLYWQLGIFQPEDTDSGAALTSRLVIVPWNDDTDLFHLGFSFSERDLDDSAFRINESFEVFGSDSLIEGKKFIAHSSSLQDVELLWQHNGLTGSAEWSQQTVEDTDGNEYDYYGGYVQFSYLFSGSKRAYKKATLGTVKVMNEWEATMRFSTFTLDYEDKKAESFGVGVNYYLNKDIKFMLNYLNATYHPNIQKQDSGDAFTFRFQFTF